LPRDLLIFLKIARQARSCTGKGCTKNVQLSAGHTHRGLQGLSLRLSTGSSTGIVGKRLTA
jgi:hypothetical protein